MQLEYGKEACLAGYQEGKWASCMGALDGGPCSTWCMHACEGGYVVCATWEGSCTPSVCDSGNTNSKSMESVNDRVRQAGDQRGAVWARRAGIRPA